MYIFGPPGWSHDNSTQTVKQMQIEQKKSMTLNPDPLFCKSVFPNLNRLSLRNGTDK